MKMDLKSFQSSKIKILILLSILNFSFFSIWFSDAASASENQIILGTHKPQETPAGTYLNLIYSEAFRRLGLTLVYQYFPAKRSSLMSDNGTIDGELSRIYTYNEVHPHMIRIEEPHWTSGFIAVTTNEAIKLDGWDSLRNTDFRVVYMAGIKGCEVNLPKVVKPAQLEVVMHTSHGFRMLLKGRADIHIGSEMDMIDLLETDEFRNTSLRIAGVMERFTAHAFLHQRHQHLVPKLSAVLKEMKKERLLESYKAESRLNSYLKD